MVYFIWRTSLTRVIQVLQINRRLQWREPKPYQLEPKVGGQPCLVLIAVLDLLERFIVWMTVLPLLGPIPQSLHLILNALDPVVMHVS